MKSWLVTETDLRVSRPRRVPLRRAKAERLVSTGLAVCDGSTADDVRLS